MGRKRVSSFVINLRSNPVEVTVVGRSPRGTKFGHTQTEVKGRDERGRPDKTELSKVFAKALGQ